MRMDKLTLKAQDAFANAQNIATGKNHYEIQPEHLLKALVEQDGGIFNSIAQKIGISVNDIKNDVEEANVRGILCAPRVPDMVKNLLADYDLEWKEVERNIVLPDDFQKTLKEY